MDFESLVGRINQVQDVLQVQAFLAVNLALTARNWLVGFACCLSTRALP